eukprot:scaffold156422_cov34-Prasinocladus_malaysianus.AAC.1
MHLSCLLELSPLPGISSHPVRLLLNNHFLNILVSQTMAPLRANLAKELAAATEAAESARAECEATKAKLKGAVKKGKAMEKEKNAIKQQLDAFAASHTGEVPPDKARQQADVLRQEASRAQRLEEELRQAQEGTGDYIKSFGCNLVASSVDLHSKSN